MLPTDSWKVHGIDGPKYKVAAVCSNPTCTSFADHAHHLWRRSQIGGDFAWVTVKGELVANLTGLCHECHTNVTGTIGGHRNAIRYEDGVFFWCDLLTVGDEIEFLKVGPLDPQPPAPGTLATRASGPDHEPTSCPFCGQARRRAPRLPHSGGRRRKTWPVKVPADAQENGADTLDALVDDLAPLLGYTAEPSARYYVLIPVLYFVQQNRHAFLESIRGVGA